MNRIFLSKSYTWLDLLFMTGLFSLVVVTGFFYAGYAIDFHHDGVVFKPAFDIARGAILYRDTFFQYGPLTSWSHALILKVFGYKLIFLKKFTAVVYGVAAVLLYMISKHLVPRFLCFLLGIVWLALAPYHVWNMLAWSSALVLIPQLLATLFLISYAKSRSVKNLFWAGFALSMCYWIKQPTIFMFVVVSSFFIIEFFQRGNRRQAFQHLAIYLTSGIACHLIFLGIIAYQGALTDWYKQTIIFPLSFAGGRMNLLNLFPYFTKYTTEISWSILPLVTLLYFLFFSLKIISGKSLKTSETAMFLILLVCLGSWQQYLPVMSIRHVYWGSTPMLAPFFFLVYNFASILSQKIQVRFAPAIKILVFIGLSSLVLYTTVRGRFIQGSKKLFTKTHYVQNISVFSDIGIPSVKIRDEIEKFGQVKRLLDTITPNRGIVNLHYDMIFASIFDGPNPYKMTVNWNFNSAYPKRWNEICEAIKKESPFLMTSRNVAEKKSIRNCTYHYHNSSELSFPSMNVRLFLPQNVLSKLEEQMNMI